MVFVHQFALFVDSLQQVGVVAQRTDDAEGAQHAGTVFTDADIVQIAPVGFVALRGEIPTIVEFGLLLCATENGTEVHQYSLQVVRVYACLPLVQGNTTFGIEVAIEGVDVLVAHIEAYHVVLADFQCLSHYEA